jgi:uncharacterized membrane protein YhfC
MNILLITHALNGLLMIAMPIVLAILLTRRWRMGWGLWWIGAATFVLSQVGHIPFNWAAGLVLNRVDTMYWPLVAQQIFNAVFLGLSAGLWEEGMRYIVLRWWAKKARSWRSGVLFGAGHGGAEAAILGLLVLFGYLAMLAIRSMDLSALMPAAQSGLVQQQSAAYWSLPWYDSLLGALERFLTIPIQIAMAVIVMQTFLRRQWFWVWLAVLYHAVVDASVVFALDYISIYWIEALVAVFSIVSVWVILRLRQPEPALESSPAEGNGGA